MTKPELVYKDYYPINFEDDMIVPMIELLDEETGIRCVVVEFLNDYVYLGDVDLGSEAFIKAFEIFTDSKLTEEEKEKIHNDNKKEFKELKEDVKNFGRFKRGKQKQRTN